MCVVCTYRRVVAMLDGVRDKVVHGGETGIYIVCVCVCVCVCACMSGQVMSLCTVYSVS